MEDIVLVTGEAVRSDFVDRMEFVSSLEPSTGITAGHYTRPSLSSIHSGSYHGSIETRPQSPTLAEVLSDAGYTCIGLTTNPQADRSFDFDAGFDFYENFVDAGTRGSPLREFLARFQFVQRIYQHFFSWHSRRENRPSDREVVEMAIEEWDGATSPRFLWIHLMESHRPYGLGEEGISPALNKKAKFSPEKVSDAEQRELRARYADALERVDGLAERLLDSIDGDPLFAFTGDHGELLGEHGLYFHPPHERRLDAEIVEVPVAFNGVDVSTDRFSLIDIAPTIVATAGLDPPAEWQGRDLRTADRRSVLTMAPWRDTVDVRWQQGPHAIRFSGSTASAEFAEEVIDFEAVEKSAEVRERLRDFGYLE